MQTYLRDLFQIHTDSLTVDGQGGTSLTALNTPLNRGSVSSKEIGLLKILEEMTVTVDCHLLIAWLLNVSHHLCHTALQKLSVKFFIHICTLGSVFTAYNQYHDCM